MGKKSETIHSHGYVGFNQSGEGVWTQLTRATFALDRLSGAAQRINASTGALSKALEDFSVASEEAQVEILRHRSEALGKFKDPAGVKAELYIGRLRIHGFSVLEGELGDQKVLMIRVPTKEERRLVKKLKAPAVHNARLTMHLTIRLKTEKAEFAAAPYEVKNEVDATWLLLKWSDLLTRPIDPLIKDEEVDIDLSVELS